MADGEPASQTSAAQLRTRRTTPRFGAASSRIGVGPAFVLVLAAVCTAHMPAVVVIGYAPWDLEILVTLAVLAAVALAAAAALHRIPALLYLFVCFWVYWAVDAYVPDATTTSVAGWLMALTGMDLSLTGWRAATAVGVAAAIWVLLLTPRTDSVRAMLIAFAAVWFVGLWMSEERQLLMKQVAAADASGPARAPPTAIANTTPPAGGFRAADGRLRPFVHIILDEQMSPRSLPEQIPDSHAAGAIIDDYVARGFTYHSRVLSTAAQTHRSLSAMLAMDRAPDSQTVRAAGGSPFRYETVSNTYTQMLLDMGYRLHISQTAWLRICPEAARADCRTHVYGRTGPMAGYIDADAQSRLAILTAQLHRAYGTRGAFEVTAYQALEDQLKLIDFDHDFDDVYYSNPIGALNVLRQAFEEIKAIEPGDAYIVHALLPHFPYMTDDACRIKPSPEWTAPKRHEKLATKGIPVEKIYADYWDQAACAHKLVMALIDEVRKQSAVDPVILVHGDHGARIQASFEELEGDGMSDDMRQTFFAAYTGMSNEMQQRDSGVEDSAPKNLPSLFSRFVGDQQSANNSNGPAVAVSGDP